MTRIHTGQFPTLAQYHALLRIHGLVRVSRPNAGTVRALERRGWIAQSPVDRDVWAVTVLGLRAMDRYRARFTGSHTPAHREPVHARAEVA